jgi:hypothetical protein
VRDTASGRTALGEAARESTAPAILVIGENVKLRGGVDWLGALSGACSIPIR